MVKGPYQNGSHRPFSVAGCTIILGVLIVLMGSVSIPSATGAVTGAQIESGSSLVYDRSGHIGRFTIWLRFPEPMDTAFADRSIEIRYTGNSWRLDDDDMPFEHNWSADQQTLFISSGNRDISDRAIYAIGVSISNDIRTRDGDFLSFHDGSSVELMFGDANRIDLGFGFFEIFALFFFPFLLLGMVVVSTEIVLRLFYRIRKVEEKGSATENLMRLIDRSEGWMKRRFILGFLFSLVLISIYVLLVAVALLNLFFAMVATLLVALFILPWILFIVLSVIYIIIRREDLYWKKRLAAVRKSQSEFMRNLSKE